MDTAITQTVERLRSQAETEADTLRQKLTSDSDKFKKRLDEAGYKLQQHQDDLSALTARCQHVNIMSAKYSSIYSIWWS